MSQSLFYQQLGVFGYQHVRSRKEQDGLHLTISQKRQSFQCSRCGSSHVHGKGTRHRSFRAPAIVAANEQRGSTTARDPGRLRLGSATEIRRTRRTRERWSD